MTSDMGSTDHPREDPSRDESMGRSVEDEKPPTELAEDSPLTSTIGAGGDVTISAVAEIAPQHVRSTYPAERPPSGVYKIRRSLRTAAVPILMALVIILLLIGAVLLPSLLYPSLSEADLSRIPTAEGIQLQNERLKLQNEARNTLLAGVGGVLVLLGAAVVFRQLQLSRELNQEQLMLTRQAQITDRFTRAIDQLGAEAIDVRFGAIYGLERIAKDSLEDRYTVVEVLTAYVRGHAPWPPSQFGQFKGSADLIELPSLRVRAADLQVAMAVLSRIADFGNGGALDFGSVDLRKADLRETSFARANFSGAKLDGANLVYANWNEATLRAASLVQSNLFEVTLRQADLTGADLQFAVLRLADLRAANLQDARLSKADLEGARLGGARLLRADLQEANLRGASLRSSGLQGANLVGADLEQADLAGADFSRAKADETTRWPSEFDPRAAGVVIIINQHRY